MLYISAAFMWAVNMCVDVVPPRHVLAPPASARSSFPEVKLKRV